VHNRCASRKSAIESVRGFHLQFRETSAQATLRESEGDLFRKIQEPGVRVLELLGIPRGIGMTSSFSAKMIKRSNPDSSFRSVDHFLPIGFLVSDGSG